MSEYASAIDRVRRAFASVSKLESELMRDPTNIGLRVNLAASQKLARKSEAQLRTFSELQRVDICNYRLLSDKERGWTIATISRSLSEYQSLFTQIHDAVKNGPKNVARFGHEVMQESAMELAYTYSGSLGFVLLAYSDRDFFEGRLDKSIDTLLEVTSIKSTKDVRQIANNLGNAVVKRLYDWSKANVEGRFSTDLIWQRSDGLFRGHVVDYEVMFELVNAIAASGEEKTITHQERGILIGGDIGRGSFHFVIPEGADFRGSVNRSGLLDVEMTLGRYYVATITEKSVLNFATEKEERTFTLDALYPV